MLRFLPDDWLEGLLRPFLLMDPTAGLYLEFAAPDWRFAVMLACLLAAAVTQRRRLTWAGPQVGALLSLAAMFYVWTFAIGNGRYFVGGLLLVGPLVMMAWRFMPGTTAFKNLLLLLVFALQAYTIQLHYSSNEWGMVAWKDGPGLSLEASPLREQPAVFLTISINSYSILVPKFHPQSRWANIAGQSEITPAAPEYRQLRALLGSPLPKYLVAPLNPDHLSADLQPTGPLRNLLNRSLAIHGLTMLDGACTALRSGLEMGVYGHMTDATPRQGFSVCLLHSATVPLSSSTGLDAQPLKWADVFEGVERRCPRFFPPGGGKEVLADELVIRRYSGSDMRLYVDSAGQVSFRYFRSLNPTLIGSVEAVREGRFTIPCDRLPGRYRAPWKRSWDVDL